MKVFNKLTAGASALVLGTAMLLGMGGVAQAATCWQYNPNGFPTSQTPVFNNICGVPGYGNESDFVRIRQSNGNDTSTSNNADYASTISNACTDGTEFDVHTYIHNDAEPEFNDNGSGSAVAHNVALAMTAALGQTASNFNFGSTISASNAASVHDTATLNCSGGPVTLSLVPNTVQIYGSYAYSWTGMPDSAVNGTSKLGNPVKGSGDMWGCWNYRMAVVYEVKVTKPAPKPTPSAGQCKAVGLTIGDNRTVTVTVNGETTNAQVIGYSIDFGDGYTSNQQTATHQYAGDGTYTIVAQVEIKLANGQIVWKTAEACQKQVTFTSHKPPTVTPPTTVVTTTPPSVTPPSQLVNTGPGSVFGIFAAVTATGAGAYRWFLGRKLGYKA